MVTDGFYNTLDEILQIWQIVISSQLESSFAQQNFIPKAFINGTIILHYKFEQSGISE